MPVVLSATLTAGLYATSLEGAWNGSWNGGVENPSVLCAAAVLSCGIGAGSGPEAMEHASCNRPDWRDDWRNGHPVTCRCLSSSLRARVRKTLALPCAGARGR